ncbi:hypothetical protein [Paraburkholderia acidipaludis]|uniref:hypothetical protein n=1 Tax=Paraburkholderia acidipaludis TaxID=660537 RepID=UPI00047FD387|nr:hypothetical protein [Paraburkholderia acidipaludis]
MSASKPKAPAPAPEDPLDEALEETFPASDPIAVGPERGNRESGEDARDGKKKHHDGGHHGGKH